MILYEELGGGGNFVCWMYTMIWMYINFNKSCVSVCVCGGGGGGGRWGGGYNI